VQYHIIAFHNSINISKVTLNLWRLYQNIVGEEYVPILGKNGTNGKVGKNGTLVLIFPKSKTSNSNSPLLLNPKIFNPNIKNATFLPNLLFVPLLTACDIFPYTILT